MTPQEICDKHNMRVVLIGYKDGSRAIHLSKEATQKDALHAVLEAFKEKK